MHAVGPTGGVGFPTWHHSGARLGFEWNGSIYTIADDGSGLTPIRTDEGAGGRLEVVAVVVPARWEDRVRRGHGKSSDRSGSAAAA